ncbi:hypothetical protein EV188_1116 [Actinomycetospora succinea]|uniref:Uncharacterized protein n=1 Tax=Actinomycetospora succinea TaxID=663603 RepID=A0A4R6URI3_9PSEU|nr:hypothetical protein EV188_1116 [Actinomycetospora succinea]
MTAWQWVLVGFGVWLAVALPLGFAFGRVLRDRRVIDTDALEDESSGEDDRATAQPPAASEDDTGDEGETLAEHWLRHR